MHEDVLKLTEMSMNQILGDPKQNAQAKSELLKQLLTTAPYHRLVERLGYIWIYAMITLTMTTIENTRFKENFVFLISHL